jgi:cobalt/nickel transport protein
MRNRKALLWIGLAAALVIAVFISPYASSHPDGLERVAMDHDFIEREKDSAWTTPVSGYEWNGAKNSPAIATAVSGLAGVVLTFGAVYAIGKWAAYRKRGGKG